MSSNKLDTCNPVIPGYCKANGSRCPNCNQFWCDYHASSYIYRVTCIDCNKIEEDEGELKFCGKDGCYRDDGDGGEFCMTCKHFWCNKHTNHIFGQACVDCNNNTEDDGLFDDCWREICPYGPDCPRECNGTHYHHDDGNLKEETISAALQACVDKNGIECFRYHTHDVDFKNWLPLLQKWVEAKRAINNFFSE